MVSSVTIPSEARIQRAWEVLGTVLDPEVPALSVCELGIVREIFVTGDKLEIMLTPTYSGCPATELISCQVLEAIVAAGLDPVGVHLRRSPAWTSDWISAEGRRKLNEYGIAPPGPVPANTDVPLRFNRRPAIQETPLCPRCASNRTVVSSAFGSTACKALYRCLSCQEPFEYFKAI